MKRDAADTLAWQLAAYKLPPFRREYRFAAVHAGGIGQGLRKRLAAEGIKDWRFDIAWPAHQLAVEVDGGGWVQGRHSRGQGIEDDCEKFSVAVSLGWRVMRVTPKQVDDGRALRWIERALWVDGGARELWRRLV